MNDGKCVVAIFDISGAANYNNVDWVVAEPFHRAYCNVYSFQDNKIGFARAHQSEI